MKYLYKDIVLPAWISYRTYFSSLENSRTYIMNERKHSYSQLDGLSSDFWEKLASPEEEFYAFLDDKQLTEAADGFLEMLAEQGLVVLNNYVPQSQASVEVFDTQDGNEAAHFVEDMNSWLYSNGFMSSIFFELTYRCNLKCIHCYNPKHMSDVEISFEKAKQIIDEAYDLGCISVTLSGGESTTYLKFLELADYIRSKHMALEVFTNGQRLAENEDDYRALVSLYPHKVGISLYSMDEDQHEKVTSVRGSYQKSIDVIKRLREDGILVQIKNFLLGFTCHDCLAVKEFGQSINAIVTPDISLIPTIEGDHKTLQFSLDEEDLFELFSNPESPLYIGSEPYIFNIADHLDESLCFGGFSGLCVAPSLEVHVCTSLPMSLGNLHEESLTKIWEDAGQKLENSKLYQWRKKTYEDLVDCYKQSYCRFCHYCAGMGYLENGYLKKSDVLCKQAKAKERAYNYLCEKQIIKEN